MGQDPLFRLCLYLSDCPGGGKSARLKRLDDVNLLRLAVKTGLMGAGFAICMGWAVQGFAQGYEDPMELQRCIWRCLADSPGAASQQYAQCVEALCSDGPPEPFAPSYSNQRYGNQANAPLWFATRTGDGQGNLAGVEDPLTGNSFFVMCDAKGRHNLALFGPEGPDAPLVLNIGAQRFEREFVGYDGGYYASVAAGSAEVMALMTASDLIIANAAGSVLMQIVLNGAQQAIIAACPQG